MAASRRLVIRVPNHLGELVLALPALRRASSAEEERGAARPLGQVVPGLRPVLEWAAPGLQVLPMRSRRAFVREASALRMAAAGGRMRGVTLTPSFSSALILRLGGVHELRGATGDFRSRLLTDPVDRTSLRAMHRVNEYLALLGFENLGEPPAPGIEDHGPARAAWSRLCSRISELAQWEPGAPVVGMCPGANGRSRRWPTDRFAELATRLAVRGGRIVAFGAKSEAPLTRAVAGRAADRGVDLGGKTSIVEMAGALLSCDLLVTNDTGPMHLAAALGVPVLALEGPADVRQTRPLGPEVRLLGRFDLPCVPCVRNVCPRTGPGYELAEAEQECMRLIEVDEVEAAACLMVKELA